jgi:hypothetical protein
VKNAISGEDEAFRILAGYVFGANQVRNKLSVLTPIEVTGRYVTAQAVTTSIEVVRMRFFLESRTLETAPPPLDPRIRVLAVGEQRIGVLRFRSGRDPHVLPGYARKLITALTGAGWKAVGDPAVFLYGPQFLSRLPHQTKLRVAVGHARSEIHRGADNKGEASRSEHRLTESVRGRPNFAVIQMCALA